ncbi:hypothetical protein [Achromobacter xylosoxidans]|uniref:hypothetical protein n=1 Tax=Alcaligenes xylosoxydans xylosoxydans TaxID=85698 RepID=UPI0013F4EC7F|nr:hypothetical protein [Achromobacter xylosoxidans]
MSSYNRTNYTEEKKEEVEKDREKKKKIRIKKAPSIDRAHRVSLPNRVFNVVLLLHRS